MPSILIFTNGLFRQFSRMVSGVETLLGANLEEVPLAIFFLNERIGGHPTTDAGAVLFFASIFKEHDTCQEIKNWILLSHFTMKVNIQTEESKTQGKTNRQMHGPQNKHIKGKEKKKREKGEYTLSKRENQQ